MKTCKDCIHFSECGKYFEKDDKICEFFSKKTDLKEIGKRIKVRRITLGYSQRRLAAKEGISHITISKIERGKEEMGIRLLIRICKSLKMSSDELLGLQKGE